MSIFFQKKKLGNCQMDLIL